MSSAEGHNVAVGRCTQQRNFTKKAVNIIARTQGYQKDCPMLQQLCATCITQTLSNIYISPQHRPILKQQNTLSITKTWHRPVYRKRLLLVVLASTL